jgi:lipopolysaccharide/colanic/teichoic acid biosynthesis glycosyltransferase
MSPFSRLLAKKVESRIPSKEEFNRILKRERARADRSGDVFSIVVFEVNYYDKSKLDEHHLVETISMRIRPTDDMGWFDVAKIGITLPNTNARGAKKLADDICKKISDKIQPPPYEVYTYPFGKGDNLKDPSQDIFNGEEDKTAENSELMTFKNIEAIKFENSTGRIEPLLVPRTPFWKRGIDIGFSLFGLILLFPVFLLIAILIKVMSPGPIFFKQKRVGYLGTPFLCYKFRTMHVNSDEAIHTNYLKHCIDSEKPLEKLDKGDPRIYPFGNILRTSCLDELPQLINVLKGEMSLVGPRPELYNIFPMYDQWCKKRFDAIPGMTGSWQINGKNTTTFKDMMREDIDYIVRKSFWYDAKILLKTFPAVLSGFRSN